MFDKSDRLSIFALLWSIYGSVYTGPKFGASILTLIAIIFWVAALVALFTGRTK